MKKKLFSVLFAVVLVFSLSLVTAVPVAAQSAPIGDPFFTYSNQGTAEWSTEQKTVGDYSAKLYIPSYDSGRQYDEARVVFNYEGDLNSIEGVSYPSYVIGGNDGAFYPSVVLAVDIDDDPEVDSWVVQFTPLDSHTPFQNDWETISFDESSPVHVAGDTTGLPEGHYKPYTTDFTDIDTLDSLKVLWGDVKVLEVKAMIGAFTSLAEEMTAYVDDITINGVVCDLEPSGALGMTGSFTPVIGISVNPTFVDFGTSLAPGISSPIQTVTVTNEGTITADFSASLTNVSTPGVYEKGLAIGPSGGDLVLLTDWMGEFGVLAKEGKSEDLTLTVPDGTAPGTYTAVLVFWAEQATP